MPGVEGMRVIIGNRTFIGEAGLATGALEREITRIESEAKTVIIVVREDEIAAVVWSTIRILSGF